MAVQTPIAGTRDDSVLGDKRVVMATFSSVANNDTFATGLGVIRGISIDSGNAGTAQAGGTFSGGTVTFAISSGPATNVQLIAFGY